MRGYVGVPTEGLPSGKRGTPPATDPGQPLVPLKMAAAFAPTIMTAAPASARAPPRWPLAVKFQPVDDLVDHLALGAHRQPDQVEFAADH